jgi:hypothetical protein
MRIYRYVGGCHSGEGGGIAKAPRSVENNLSEGIIERFYSKNLGLKITLYPSFLTDFSKTMAVQATRRISPQAPQRKTVSGSVPG